MVKINRHMDQYMSEALKGIGRSTRGAKHQLLRDREVAQKTRLTNESIAWTNYNKAREGWPTQMAPMF